MSKYIHQQQNKINDLQVKISELKAENERLKKYETIYYLNQLQASNEDIDKFKQNQIQQSINISDLKQQLKEKDEEINMLHNTIAELSKMVSRENHKATKQVCEKIETSLLDFSNGWWRYFMTDGCEYMLSSDLQGCIDEILDQIENEKESN